VNFIESHEKTAKLISEVIPDRQYVYKVIEEGLKQERLAEQYVVDHIEAVFPEICTAIQLRRAKFTILRA
jgi:hypothetical protein|tara:strand:- start:477 stop:686 length:210 start_codon:yes stop_codon:yes gene_type:complete